MANDTEDEVKNLLTLRAKINSRLAQLAKEGKYTPKQNPEPTPPSTSEIMEGLLSQRNLRAEIGDPRWSNWNSFNTTIHALTDKRMSDELKYTKVKKFLFAMLMNNIPIDKVMSVLEVMKRETTQSAWNLIWNEAKRLWDGEIPTDRW